MKRDDSWEDKDIDHAGYEEESWKAATLARNDPDYIAGLEELKRISDEISAATTSIILYRDRRRTRIEVGLGSPTNRSLATNVACRLGELLEAPVRVVDAPEAGNTPDVTQRCIKGDPAHKFYRGDVTFKRR